MLGAESDFEKIHRALFCPGVFYILPLPEYVTFKEMRFQASVEIMPHKVLLDPQGKAVTSGLKNLGLNEIDNVRVGKHITLEIEAASEDEANSKVEEACKKLLANPIMESFEYKLEAL